MLDNEDVVKHAKAIFVDGDFVDGVAFLPRPNDQDGSSVNRLRLFSDEDDEAMIRVRQLSRLTLRPSHRFAQLKIQSIKAAVSNFCTVDASAAPLAATDAFEEDPSHALLTGLPPAGVIDDLIGDLISRTITQVHQAT